MDVGEHTLDGWREKKAEGRKKIEKVFSLQTHALSVPS